MPRTIRVRSIYGGVTYEVQSFWGCVGLFAIGKYGVSSVADCYYPTVENVLADDYVEVK